MSDFEFYCDEYGGALIEDEEEFERLARRARLFISRVTCTEPDFEDDDVRSCMCAICEIYAERLSNGAVTREKVDGFEAEYDTDKEDRLILHTAKLYLPPVLLYRGF